ncbi:MAG TPA: xanthine dehydrogenase family protein subunit M, partial [Dongiaceae bacterium]
SYHRPRELGDALAVLREGAITVIAGGTDYYPARVERPANEDLLDITAISALRRIDITPTHFRIGAGVTWTDLIRADLPPCFDGLKLAAREIGGVQIQNAGTLAGNVCNASPAADSMPNLLALDTEVELASTQGQRRLKLGDFVTGNRKTLRRPDELVTALLIPRGLEASRSSFVKLGARRYLVISIVMLAAVMEKQEGKVAAARIAVGACSEVARRLPALERALLGRPWDRTLAAVIEPSHLAGLSPIDDVRAGAAYRRDAAQVLLRRALEALGEAA